jgi:hypothetical protein
MACQQAFKVVQGDVIFNHPELLMPFYLNSEWFKQPTYKRQAQEYASYGHETI